jgi:hypothetical protein
LSIASELANTFVFLDNEDRFQNMNLNKVGLLMNEGWE